MSAAPVACAGPGMYAPQSGRLARLCSSPGCDGGASAGFGRACNRRAARRVQSGMRAPPVVTAVVLAAALTACDTRVIVQPARSPAVGAGTAAPATTAAPRRAGGTASAAPRPPVTGPAALTTADNGVTVRLRPGQQVTVTLPGRGHAYGWHIPAVAGTAVRRISASGGYPTQQPARAAFLAIHPGTATISASDDTACLHAQPSCALPQREWRATIIVTGSDPSP